MEQLFGILKKQWLILKIAGEQWRERKVSDAWCSIILHNLLVRYRRELALLHSAEYRALMAEFERLVEEVNAELLVEPPLPSPPTPQDSDQRRGVDARLKRAGKDMRLVIANKLWNDRHAKKTPF